MAQQSQKQHLWLSQVEVSGIVFSEPVLADTAPTGFRQLEKHEIAQFRKAHDRWKLPKGMVQGDPQIEWIDFILHEILKLKSSYWRSGADISSRVIARAAETNETLRPHRVLTNNDEPIMLMYILNENQNLDKPWEEEGSRWKASPSTKMDKLLRNVGLEMGIITNGESWRLIISSPSETTSWITWTAQTWIESYRTLAAFKDLLGETRFFAGAIEETIIELVKKSRERQLDVADQLGLQSQEALSMFIHELDRVDAESNGDFLRDYEPNDIYEASAIFLMRIIFLLYAEENHLLPHGNVKYDQTYGIIHLLTELEERKRINPESLPNSYEAYSRILATSRLIHQGSIDAEIQVPIHGGNLFDPDQHPLLEGRLPNGDWILEPQGPPKISDDLIRDLLRRVKYAQGNQKQVQLVSYRTLAVEQIGYMYEGLLDRKVSRSNQNTELVILKGTKKDDNPIINLKEIDDLDHDELVEFLVKITGRTQNNVQNLVTAQLSPYNTSDPGTEDPQVLARLEKIRTLMAPRGYIRPGGIYSSTSTARGEQGAYYTSPSLTEPIVKTTLEPLIYKSKEGRPGDYIEPRELINSYELLDLNVCDPAMGSGAFLVQITRYLGDRLQEIWESIISRANGEILTVPHGEVSKGKPDEILMPDTSEKRKFFAYRYVAERCVYGVDVNPLAAEMAKLSIWLVTLSYGHRFSFLDHALKIGNGLMSANIEQIKKWDLHKKGATSPLFNTVIEKAVSESVSARNELSKLAVTENESLQKKILKKASDASEKLKLMADLLLGAYFKGDSKNEISNLLSNNFSYAMDLSSLRSFDDALAHRKYQLAENEPFHWEIEFPEVFQKGGFDAFVGNPPFLGGRRIRSRLGDDFFMWLKKYFQPKSMNGDLCGFFLLMCFKYLKPSGVFGLITTNTISQGDTREVSLKKIKIDSGDIFNATKNLIWPGKSNVVVSLVFVIKENFLQNSFSTYLNLEKEYFKIKNLKLNKYLSYTGVYLNGKGFVLEPNEASQLINSDKKYFDVISRYLIGKDVLSSPQQKASRFVINFFNWDIERAKTFEKCFSILEEKVKPYREGIVDDISTHPWWQYWRTRNELYNNIENREEIIVCSRVQKYLIFAWVDSNQVISDRLYAFPKASNSIFSILQSIIHYEWTIKFTSTLKQDIAYVPSDCLETFPFPNSNPFDQIDKLESIGDKFQNKRNDNLLKYNIGLTDFYNLFHTPACMDSDIRNFRELQLQMDHEVARAYGWNDLDLSREWQDSESYQGEKRWALPKEVSEEVIDRLYELNQQRFEEEKASE